MIPLKGSRADETVNPENCAQQEYPKELIMASSSNTTPDIASTTLSLPSFKQTIASKVDYLYEITHVPEESIPSSELPFLNPYSIFPGSSSKPYVPVLTHQETVPPPQPYVPILTHQKLVPTPVSKGKSPMVPIPEYIPEITGGASTWLPSEILPVEEPNPISSFLRATTLKDYEENISSDSGNLDGQIYMADPGPSVQHPDEASTMDQDPPHSQQSQPQTAIPQTQYQTETKYVTLSTFTLEDIPPSQWRQCFDEWLSWLILQHLQPAGVDK
ncbi:hypothetical protein ACLOJK_000196 [Asimina triloba]